jgi:glycosyltransferase involved in cell wall biosynthesis
MPHIRMLGVLICYNDGDILEDAIRYLLTQDHHLVVWDHGSTDGTAGVIRKFQGELLESRHLPREFDFYDLYPAMSRHLLENYVANYNWISWPDVDEFLEGPSRSKAYSDWLEEAHASPYSWMQFNNFNYWFTSADNPEVKSPVARIRHYSLFSDCAPRIRSWRASSTNIRIFNHNPPLGDPWPALFNLRHYPMRSREQMLARVLHDRAGLRRGNANYHHDYMRDNREHLEIEPQKLHYDDGRSDLDPQLIFNWRSIYGFGPPAETES